VDNSKTKRKKNIRINLRNSAIRKRVLWSLAKPVHHEQQKQTKRMNLNFIDFISQFFFLFLSLQNVWRNSLYLFFSTCAAAMKAYQLITFSFLYLIIALLNTPISLINPFNKLRHSSWCDGVEKWEVEELTKKRDKNLLNLLLDVYRIFHIRF
jgi:hypothetical protein